MLKTLTVKLTEALKSVLPVTLIVLAVYFTPAVSLTADELITFLICSVFLIIGIALFNLGADMALTPMGEAVGSGLTKTRKLMILLSVCFVMGVLITVAEPDLSVLAGQVSAVINSTALIVTVGVGVGLFLVFAVAKIIFRKNLSMLLMYSYAVLFALGALLTETGRSLFLPMSFDSGGVTTGPITVPFLMALGVGIATTIGGHDVSENSFGMIALCSAGPIAAVLFLSITAKGDLTYSLPDYSMRTLDLSYTLSNLAKNMLDVGKAIGLIALFFAIIQITVLKLKKRQILKIAIGILYTFVGLCVFLTAVSVGFMPVGFMMGSQMAEYGEWLTVLFGFLIGAVVVLAEPAVHVLNNQVEQITGGAVTRRSMLIALSCGVGISIGLSVLRIVFDFSLLYYIIPGYFISLGLALFVPGLYTAIAFDSGGVASGPLTSGFILPLMTGICYVLHGEESIMSLAFGVVAMVAMTPLITIQVLGFRAIVSAKVRRDIALRRIVSAADEQIIYFE